MTTEKEEIAILKSRVDYLNETVTDLRDFFQYFEMEKWKVILEAKNMDKLIDQSRKIYMPAITKKLQKEKDKLFKNIK